MIRTVTVTGSALILVIATKTVKVINAWSEALVGSVSSQETVAIFFFFLEACSPPVFHPLEHYGTASGHYGTILGHYGLAFDLTAKGLVKGQAILLRGRTIMF